MCSGRAVGSGGCFSLCRSIKWHVVTEYVSGL